ncbi:MAG: hypothetical protein QGI45_07015, partial [Myxococcota bacterium]|nr:hypothetical protein [Myxococcota bacterium]
PACNTTTNTCVACTDDAHCNDSNASTDDHCKADNTCVNCSSEQVWDASSETCVECLDDNDCAEGETCENGACQASACSTASNQAKANCAGSPGSCNSCCNSLGCGDCVEGDIDQYFYCDWPEPCCDDFGCEYDAGACVDYSSGLPQICVCPDALGYACEEIGMGMAGCTYQEAAP